MRFYEEMHLESGAVRDHYGAFARWLSRQTDETMRRKRAEADLMFRRVGITFSVNGDEAGGERLIPFDRIPRIVLE